MQLQHVNSEFSVDAALAADLARLEQLWHFASELSDGTGPWLLGRYSLADVFYAPVCARIIGYNLPVSEPSKSYVMTTRTDPAFKNWRAEGLKTTYDPFPYDTGGKTTPWPVD